ncbi:MAG TPA: PEP-CTERM sorting domain-containing protein, partial [Phycisphaerae bacterium]|nr:PEP-CTERM sorting domain-containing protein [Phycisphaerae bacterium]
AAHVGNSGGDMNFALDSGTYQRAWKQTHPNYDGNLAEGWDVSLVRLTALVLDEATATLNADANEIGQTGVITGFGKTGTGLTGATEPSGTKRAGENAFEVDGTYFGDSDRLMLADFDNPLKRKDSWFGGRTPFKLEYLAAPGDSGGGVFIWTGDGWKLAGVTSFITWRDADGDSDYGDAMGAVRVSQLYDWIAETMTQSYTMYWQGGAGGYNVAENWETTFDGSAVGCVPGACDVMAFGTAGTHSVTWPEADLANARLIVSAGDVTLDLSGRIHTLTSEGTAEPSLLVGDAAGTQSLTITNGTLLAQDAFIGSVAGSDGTLLISDLGAYSGVGSLYIGGTDSGAGGTGTVSIAAGGSVSVAGTITVWSSGTLNLDSGTLGAADANLHVPVENDGLLHVTAGSHAVGSVAPVDADVLAGTTQIDANASLSVSSIVQDTVTIGANATLTICGSYDTAGAMDSLSVGGDELQLDVELLSSQSGVIGAADGQAAVPEPASAVWLLLGVLGLVRRRRR